MVEYLVANQGIRVRFPSGAFQKKMNLENKISKLVKGTAALVAVGVPIACLIAHDSYQLSSERTSTCLISGEGLAYALYVIGRMIEDGFYKAR